MVLRRWSNFIVRIFIDADACPKKAKEILFRAALRTKTELILIANRFCQTPISPYIRGIIVSSGLDEADKRIVDEARTGDLVITADIPLASEVVAKGCIALNPRGTVYDKESIAQHLAVRNLMSQLREQQLIFGGASSYNAFDTQAFANQLDKILVKAKN